ncbi:membrane protein [Clostridium sp. KNHs214]|uniref:membrane protein n=1 Tax=Clostridium sp. KNHs214 TaxID=1540257 RepID=UPI00054F41DB|nr:membrane protein [Clostridium sp. KNHs214]
MNILTLTCNIGIPIIMIFIGILYKYTLYKNIHRTLNLIIPVAMIFTGFSDDKSVAYPKDTSTLALANRKCSLIWSISGACTLLLTIIFLILNKSTVHNISVILLELECLILVGVFITMEYILKRNFYKKYEQY